MRGAGREGGAVGLEIRDEGVEVAAAEDAVLFEVEVELISGATVGGGIHKDGEVGVIVLHAGNIMQAADTRYSSQRCPVELCNAFAGCDGGIYPTEVQKAVCSANFVHFGVDARGNHFHLAGEAEIFELVNLALHFRSLADQCATLHRVVHLGGVEREGAHVSGVKNTDSVLLDAESMGGVVNDFQTMLICNALQCLGIARIAVYMYGHDGHGFVRNGCLHRCRVEVAIDGVYIRKDRRKSVPNERVRGGNKGERRGDDLPAVQSQCLEGGDEGEGAIGKE